MKLSQSVAYAVQAAIRLAEEPTASPISCGQLATTGQMPERFLLQILRDMTKQGILSSTRGGGGGFMLGRRPEEISLLDMIEAVDGPISAALPGKGSFPEESAARLQDMLKEITEQVRRELAAIRLADLMTAPQHSGESSDVSSFPLMIDEPHPHIPPRMVGMAVKTSEFDSL